MTGLSKEDVWNPRQTGGKILDRQKKQHDQWRPAARRQAERPSLQL